MTITMTSSALPSTSLQETDFISCIDNPVQKDRKSLNVINSGAWTSADHSMNSTVNQKSQYSIDNLLRIVINLNESIVQLQIQEQYRNERS